LKKGEWKKITGVLYLLTILTLYAAVLTNSSVSANSTELPSQYPLVYVYPELVTAEVGENITVSVVVYNLTDGLATDPDNPQAKVPLGNLYAFDIQFSWDPTIIKYVNHTVTTPVEKYPSPVPPSPYAGIIHGFGASNDSIFEIKNIVDEDGNIPEAQQTHGLGHGSPTQQCYRRHPSTETEQYSQ